MSSREMLAVPVETNLQRQIAESCPGEKAPSHAKQGDAALCAASP